MSTPTRRQITVNWLILLGSILGLIGATVAFYASVTAPPKKKKGGRDGFRFTVQTAPVERGDLTPTIRLQGDVVSRRTTTIRAEVAGIVKSVPVREGQAVKAEALLVQLDERDWKLALRRQQAMALQATATQARSDAAASKAEDELRRNVELDRHKLVTKESVLQGRLAVRSAKAGVAEARALSALRYVELLTARQNLERARVKAPFAGRLSKRYVEAGDRVAVGAPLVELVGGRGVELHLFVPVSLVNRVRPGAKLRYRTAGRAGRWREGEIRRVLPVADPSSRNQTAVVVLGDPPPGLAPGLAVEARLGVGAIRNVLLVSSDALTRFGEQWVVFRVAQGKAQRLPVSILGEDGARTAVSGALRAEDPVVVLGNEALFPNAAVRVVPTRQVAQRKPPGRGK
ncbi:MAG: efflux RND transporter periplasmic adaptor subunit [bacterium]